ncbi:MAG: multidrug ABC transporter [Flavobacterium sp. BFFFF1]|uniref:ABC transporter ATP-binding protein n=1 Tax=Flavobacterium sp. BFFFF1 TaxID=2015557 RepID=UPI000BD2C24E|nr:ABC transporter ATP-binding protein [Flavobacterium sp. BFFFF1]OYU81679.1 MAG: multidrug ABC transporter [Flavobacterium sp. BFFFF1]
MKYNLNEILGAENKKPSTFAGLRSLLKLIEHEQKNLIIALIAILLNSTLNLLGPYLIGHTVDTYIVNKDYHGVWLYSGILLTMYLLALFTSYFQTKLMGGVGQRMLFTLRNAIFNKLQSLPVAFFNANKAGDLISRVNNDTDKINTFFSQSLMQFIGSIATMTGAGIFLLSINLKLGAATLVPGLMILIFTQIISPWVKKKNAANLKSTGGLSSEIQESLANFRVIIAFNRRDYFRDRFAKASLENYKTAVGAGLANNLFLPVSTLFSSLAQLIVLAYGIYLIAQNQFSVGLLVSYLAYSVNFYNPLRQLATLWTSFQVAMAGWDRVNQILALDTDLETSTDSEKEISGSFIEFRNVHFAYETGKDVLRNVSLEMERGKTYAFVGPTGGGKSTTAALLSRLYDPTSGIVFLDGKDIRQYTPSERAAKIGFILQEPFLFTGTVKENIVYGNEQYKDFSTAQFEKIIEENNLKGLLDIFENGLETMVSSSGESISLGQKQLIAFMRAVIRKPEVLILDEATANIDTVTEQLLQEILAKLPESTTRIIIAHRLNTIKDADVIFFVNSGEIIRAGSFQDALDLLMKGKRAS